MQATKQSRCGKWCENAENNARHGKRCKRQKAMQWGAENYAVERKYDVKMRKTLRSAKNEAKRGAKSKQRGGQHALGLQQAKEAIKRKKRRKKRNLHFKMAVSHLHALDAGNTSVQRWTLGEPTSNTHCRQTACMF